MRSYEDLAVVPGKATDWAYVTPLEAAGFNKSEAARLCTMVRVIAMALMKQAPTIGNIAVENNPVIFVHSTKDMAQHQFGHGAFLLATERPEQDLPTLNLVQRFLVNRRLMKPPRQNKLQFILGLAVNTKPEEVHADNDELIRSLSEEVLHYLNHAGLARCITSNEALVNKWRREIGLLGKQDRYMIDHYKPEEFAQTSGLKMPDGSKNPYLTNKAYNDCMYLHVAHALQSETAESVQEICTALAKQANKNKEHPSSDDIKDAVSGLAISPASCLANPLFQPIETGVQEFVFPHKKGASFYSFGVRESEQGLDVYDVNAKMTLTFHHRDGTSHTTKPISFRDVTFQQLRQIGVGPEVEGVTFTTEQGQTYYLKG